MTMVCLQVKYVVELAKTLSKHPMVHRCDLLTRMIRDPEVSEDYGQEEEQIAEGQGELGGSYIRRVVAGNPKVYLPKESLWPHVRECVLSSPRSDCGIFVLPFVHLAPCHCCIVASNPNVHLSKGSLWPQVRASVVFPLYCSHY